MTPSVSELLSGYPVVIEAEVAWGDMDAFQHVNNAVYFRWFESARIAYFRTAGVVPETAGVPSGIGPILAATDCRYRIPLSYPDRISTGARVRDLEDDRFVMEYAVVSHTTEALAATGTGLIVSYDYAAAEKAALPEEMRHRIEEFEATVTR
jgi:acyl-CoA thioester hydrolase